MRAKHYVTELLKSADIEIGGHKHGDIQVHDDRFYGRVLGGGSLALGESYMDAQWDCRHLDVFFDKVLRAKLEKKVRPRLSLAWAIVKNRIVNMQTKRLSKRVAEKHYDLNNAFYESMLGKTNQYTCAYFKGASDLDRAQERKLDLICRKLQLKKGDHLLDIGCGWGGLAYYAATRYGCKVTGCTISREQAAYARKKYRRLPITIALKDYRDLEGQFDKIVSVGMFEHVGKKNYITFMRIVNRCLKPKGLFLLHTIGTPKIGLNYDRWLEKYIFPHGRLPASGEILKSAQGVLVLEDFHTFGADYDKTLMAWLHNFRTAWPRFEATYGDRFKRMWEYYLSCCAGAFRAGKTDLYQFVFSKGDLQKTYVPVR